jgi:hypothetical protein
LKICFVVEDIYPTLNPKSLIIEPNGRAIRFKNFGMCLVKIGYDVSYITLDYGQPEIEKIGKFNIYKIYKPDEGIQGLRFILTKVPKLMSALKKVNADIYAYICPDSFVGVISWFCKKNCKKFLYFSAHDKDFDDNAWKMNKRDFYLFRYGLKMADLIICQNNYQRSTLKKYYKRDSAILYNPMEPAECTYDPSGSIIWIANYHPWKRPEMLIELSRKINDDFIMIGGYGHLEKVPWEINIKSANDNIRILGSLGYDETDKLLSQAKLLVNTSESEGLPNTFLQAWRRGIPVVSFVDPDDMIKENNLGLVVENFEELIEAVEKLRKGISGEHSRKIREFFNNTFSASKIAARFDKLIKDIKL